MVPKGWHHTIEAKQKISKALKGRLKANRVKYPCAICGKDMSVIEKYAKSRKYCSTDCKIEGLARLRRKNYENKLVFTRGYKDLLIEEYGKCQMCGWNINVNILEVHHKDLNRKNNQRSNILLLCPNCHTILHYNNRTGQFKNNLGIKKVKCQ